jgi:hypothetical protein
MLCSDWFKKKKTEESHKQMRYLLSILLTTAIVVVPCVATSHRNPKNATCVLDSLYHTVDVFAQQNIFDVLAVMVDATVPGLLPLSGYPAAGGATWGMENVSCKIAQEHGGESATIAATVVLLGEPRRSSIGFRSSLSLLASEQDDDVTSRCPSSAYARWRRGDPVDMAHELVTLQLRQHPHRGGALTHGDLCDGTRAPSASQKVTRWRLATLVASLTQLPLAATSWVASWIVPSASWYESLALTTLSLVDSLSEVLMNVVHGEFVPWVVRGLSVEDVTLRVTNMTIPAAVFLEQGARAMLQHAQRHIRVHTFPSIQALEHGSASQLPRCDLNAVLLLEATHTILSQELTSGPSSAAYTSSSPAAFGHNSLLKRLISTVAGTSTSSASLVAPMCQFRLSGGNSGADMSNVETSPALEVWWRLFQQRDASTSILPHVRLHLNDDEVTTLNDGTSAGGRSVSFEAICRMERRYLDDAVCLGVHVSMSNRSDVTLTTSFRFDALWWFLLLAFSVTTLLRPLFSKHSALQVVLCFLLGVVVVLCVVIFFVAKDLHRTRIGKAGILAVVASGGVMLAVEGLASAFVTLAAHELQTNHAVHAFVALAGVVSAVLSRYLFGSILRDVTRTLFTVAQLTLVVVMSLVNMEATAAAFAAVATLKLGLLSLAAKMLVSISWSVCVRPVIAFAKLLKGSGYDANNDPSDRVPVLDESHEASYHRPLAASATAARAGRDATERFAAYEKEGSECTRRALEELAATVRAQPGKYASRVRDPNGLARFAGVE